MEFAPVASLPIYKRLADSGDLGSYHLLIATEVLKDPEAWQEFWAGDRGDDLDSRFIIMDNGVIETGFPTTPQELYAAAEAVSASCIVLPDVLGDMRMTLKVARASIKAMKKTGYPLMGVIQGRTLGDIEKLLREYHEMEVDYLSVPRIMTELHGSRVGLTQVVADYWMSRRPNVPDRFIHLLGFSERIFDDIQTASNRRVMGIDSAMPIWFGMLPYAEYLPVQPPVGDFPGVKRPADYWNAVPNDTRADFDIVRANIRKVRSWLQTAALAAPTTR